MHFSVFLASAVLAFKANAAPSQQDPNQSPVSPRSSLADFNQLTNVSTYHALTRVRGAHTTLSKHLLSRNNGYGFSPTTLFARGQGFYTPVTVGSQTFKLLIDTGSADTWIAQEGAVCIDPATQANISQGAPGCTDLGPLWDKSGCTPVPNEHFNIFYGGYAGAQGSICTIDVTIGGITARNQIVAAVSRIGFAATDGTSGILGLSYSAVTSAFYGTNYTADDRSINQAPYDPVFTTMYKQKQIPSLFSIALSRASPTRTNDGFVAFGGLAPVITYGDWAATPLQYVSLNGSGSYLPTVLPYPQHEYYVFTPDSFLYQSSDKVFYNPNKWLPLPATTSSTPTDAAQNQYTLDTGATQAYLPTVMADFLATQFNPPAVYNASIGSYTVPCNAKAPWFAIKIGGVVFPVDKRDMIIDDGTGSGLCAAGTTAGHSVPHVLGDTFLKNVMVVFDVGNDQLKFRSRGLYF